MDHVYNSKVARISIINIIPYSGVEHKADEKEETKVNMGQIRSREEIGRRFREMGRRLSASAVWSF